MVSRAIPIGLDVSRTGRVVAKAFDAALAEAGGSLPVWLVLVALSQDVPGMQREIAASIGIDGATLTHHLNKMETDALITRERDPNNRRTHRVVMTDSGRALFQTLLQPVIAFDTRLRAGFGDVELATLRDLLGRLRDNCTTHQEVVP